MLGHHFHRDLLAETGFERGWIASVGYPELRYSSRIDPFEPMTIGVKPVQATMMPEVPVEVSDHAPVLLEIFKP
ncbi:MAG: hypothetical protein AAGB14_14120 [Verrucomicrobiota bacterium]